MNPMYKEKKMVARCKILTTGFARNICCICMIEKIAEPENLLLLTWTRSDWARSGFICWFGLLQVDKWKIAFWEDLKVENQKYCFKFEYLLPVKKSTC